MSAPIKARTPWNEATQELWEIAETGEIGQLEQLLSRGADVNCRNDSGVTPLMVAAYHGRLEMVRALTDYGADPNAMDHDGFTAAMLADHLGYKDIARILVARSGKRIPKPSAYDTSSGSFTPVETFDTFSDAAVTSSVSNPEVRTLHEPPNIWDLVHETPAEFNPRAALYGRLNTFRPLFLILLAVIAGGGALYGLMKFTGGSTSAPNESAARPPDAQTAPEASATSALKSAPPLNEARSLATRQPDRTIVPVAPQTLAPHAVGLTGDTAVQKRNVVSPAEPDKRAAARKRQKEPTPSVTTDRPILGGVPDNPGITDKTEKAATPALKSDNPAPKPDSGKTAEPAGAKKEEVKKESDKAPSPESNAPAKANPTPKAKVINWP